MTTYEDEKVSLYNRNLPIKFSYPKLFLEHVGVCPVDYYYPWYFTPPSSEAGKDMPDFLFEMFRHPYIPFASYEAQDGYYACFDGEDRSDNPSVVELDIVNQGILRRYRSFAEWLVKAKREAEEW